MSQVVAERDHHVISGALLPFRAEAVDFLFAGLRDALKLKKGDALRLSQDQLMGCAPIFTSAWLFIEIDRALTPDQPQFTNSDGDDVLFHDLRYPLASGVTQKAVAERLDRVKGFLAEGPKFWNWLATRKARGGKAGGGIMLDTQMEGATVLGSLELTGKTLLVTVNSAERATKVQTLIGADAGDLLRAPLTTIRTVEQMRDDQRRDGPSDAADEIPPEIARQLMRDHLGKHCRETLEAPIPALGGKSPRQAVRTSAGREKVIDWLKMLENRSAKQGEGPIAEYDFGWRWVDLGLKEYR
jgi:hypothetical protein